MIGSTKSAGDVLAPSEYILRNDGTVYHLGLSAKDIADKVIIVGDPERVPMISSRFDNVEIKVSNREFVTHTGFIHGKRITVISSGIGVDNIDILINELDAAINIDPHTKQIRNTIRSLEIVRIGTSGALQEDIAIGSFVVSAFAFAWDGVPFYYKTKMNQEEQMLADTIDQQLKPIVQLGNCYAAKSSDSLMDRIGKGLTRGITATANGFYGPQERILRLEGVAGFTDQLRAFHHLGLRITNFEMETAGIYALASSLGHQAITVCAILANRYRKEFHNQPSESVERLIDLVLERF